MDFSLETFKSIRQYFSWLTNIRSNVYCAIINSVEATEKAFCKRKILKINKEKVLFHASKDMRLTYGHLERSFLHVRVYSDAYFATNDDHSSKIGFMVLMCGYQYRCHILNFAREKFNRVVRDRIDIETYDFKEEYDAVF